MTKSVMPRSRRKMLFGGTILMGMMAGVGAAPASAQTTAAPPPASSPDSGEVIITGSRLPQKDIVAAGPVTSLSAAAIARSSATSVGDLLQQLPTVDGDTIGSATNNAGYGTTDIAIRGLGPERTLVLINGQRAVPGGGLSTIGGVSPYVDLSSIPLGMVDHVDVYQDGASAVYGSDAIAGVVNVVFKTKYTGIEASSEFAVSGHGDGEKRDYELVMGASGERSHAIVGVSYLDVDAIVIFP